MTGQNDAMSEDESVDPSREDIALRPMGHVAATVLGLTAAYALTTVISLFRLVQGSNLILVLLFATAIGTLITLGLQWVMIETEDPLFTTATKMVPTASGGQSEDKNED